MAIDPIDVDRVRRLLADTTSQPVTEKRIIGGGHGFLVDGNLCCAVTTRGLTVRVGPADKASALTEAHVVPHLVGSRETSAFVVVQADGFATDDALAAWVQRAIRFVATLS
ncbi:MAG: TfoX/Sxy family protein [Actinomycetota bacterium]